MRKNGSCHAILCAMTLGALGGCLEFRDVPSPDEVPLPDLGNVRKITAEGYATVDLLCVAAAPVLYSPGAFAHELRPIAIDDSGAILVDDFITVGSSEGEWWTGVGRRGAVYANGTWSRMTAGEVRGLSQDGRVVGAYSEASPIIGLPPTEVQPTVWSGGERVVLPGEGAGTALSVNSSGQIVGWRDPNPPGWSFLGFFPLYEKTPILWRPAEDDWTVITLGLAPGSQTLPFEMTDLPTTPKINESGQVLLSSADGNAAVWADGVTTTVGPIEGLTLYGADINNVGQVVGLADFRDSAARANRPADSSVPEIAGHAFIYSDGGVLDMGTLGGNRSEAVALNDGGVVIGYAETDELTDYCQSAGCDNRQSEAFVFRNGAMQALRTLLPPLVQSNLVGVMDINNHNQILATIHAADENGDFKVYIAVITLPNE